MRAVAIDDDVQMHALLRDMLEMIGAEVEIVATGATVNEGIELINTHQPDLLFLDIDLPDGTGFDILEQIDFGKFLIIFISGHSQYGRLALQFEALDYLDKPLLADDLENALKRARKRHEGRNYLQRIEDLTYALENYRHQQLPKRLTVSNSEGFHFVLISEIIYFYGEKDLVIIVTSKALCGAIC